MGSSWGIKKCVNEYAQAKLWKYIFTFSNLYTNRYTKVDFEKKMINIQGQVVNQRQQTPGGESVANPWIPLLDILVENINIT